MLTERKTSSRAVWKAEETMGSGERGKKRVQSGRDPVPGALPEIFNITLKCSSDVGCVLAAMVFEETKAGAEVQVGELMM